MMRRTVVEGHSTITLEVRHWHNRRVDRKLLVVGTKAVALCIGVREETRLQHGVGRRLDAWNEMGGREGDLLDLGKVLIDHSVQDQLAEFLQRHKLLGPDLGGVENVEVELMLVSLRDDLNGERPLGRRAIQNSLVEVFAMEV